MLFNEPKLLKSVERVLNVAVVNGFSALQRAEIAEIRKRDGCRAPASRRFSALQRAEIAEIRRVVGVCEYVPFVSVLFNEPKLLKYCSAR